MKKKAFRAVLPLALAAVMTFLSACGAQPVSVPQPAGTAAAPALPAQRAPSAAAELEKMFTTVELMDATIAELQAAMEAGRLTAEQLTQMYLDRIEAYDRPLKLNSVIAVNPAALDEARALDRERSEGKVRGPLHGIPVVVKANFDVAGMATTAGSNALADLTATEDAFVVGRLREAGAVILAQTNMSEFAMSASSSRSTLGGFVHNAYDGARSPAGSSGGTAVAVTCNFAAAGLGTDTGGSIRNPASFNNLYGIRPSKGLTSIHGVVPLLSYRDTTGPIARTAEDLALLLQTIAGTDEADDYTLEAGADALLGGGYLDSLSPDALKGMRIGYLEHSFFCEYEKDGEETTVSPAPKTEAMLNGALANLRKAGAVFVDLSEALPDDTIYVLVKEIWANTFEYDLNRYLHEKGEAAPWQTTRALLESGKGVMYQYADDLAGDPEKLAESFEATRNPYSEEIGGYLRTPGWEYELESRAMVSEILEEQDVDAVMYLCCLDVAPEQASQDESGYNVASYDIAFGPEFGFPEISLPMGFADADETCPTELPLGLSVFSGFGREATLMQIAYAYEQQAGAAIRRMPERTPALPDPALNAFLTDLTERAWSIDYAAYNARPEGLVRRMLNACDRAEAVDRRDACATLEAAVELAEAYDRVIDALEASGRFVADAVVPLSSVAAKGMTAQQLEQTLRDAGFTNITLQPEYSLVTDWFFPEGIVGSVRLGGVETFPAGRVCRPDTEIVIVYRMRKPAAA